METLHQKNGALHSKLGEAIDTVLEGMNMYNDQSEDSEVYFMNQQIWNRLNAIAGLMNDTRSLMSTAAYGDMSEFCQALESRKGVVNLLDTVKFETEEA